MQREEDKHLIAKQSVAARSAKKKVRTEKISQLNPRDNGSGKGVKTGKRSVFDAEMKKRR